MNYTNFKEETTNFAVIAGKIISQPTKSHEVEGEGFYEFKVEIERMSGARDIIPVTISERTMVGQSLQEGYYAKFTGEYRSYNKFLGEKSKLILHMFAKEAEVLDKDLSKEEKNINQVKLIGYICKPPVYRTTPFEREICDVLIAVNRQVYYKSDYVPCIVWGRNAKYMANQNVGAKVELQGRIQSREYTKVLPDGSAEQNTAYEVSCQKISILENKLKFDKNGDDDKIIT